MYPEDSLLPISALQHLLFCERQCALIHLERQWAENRFTVEGQHLHRKAHHGRDEWRGDVHIVRGLWIRSFRLGLVGQADVVELEPARGTSGEVKGTVPFFFADSEKSGQSPADSEKLGQSPAFARVTPIEYKRGRPKTNDSDRVQLCAQALCLEEMLGVMIKAGELFYGKRQRRTHVEFDERLRTATQSAALRLHQMIASGETPPAVREKKCDTCSLFHLCLPEVTQTSRSATRFVGRQFAGHLRDGIPTTDLFEAMAALS
ncbi:MAG: CRISPR-associated protein Cas4 [Pirellulales bacterium]